MLLFNGYQSIILSLSYDEINTSCKRLRNPIAEKGILLSIAQQFGIDTSSTNYMCYEYPKKSDVFYSILHTPNKMFSLQILAILRKIILQ